MKMTREQAKETRIAFAIENNAITHNIGDLLVKELDKEVEVDGAVYEFTDYDFYEYKNYEHELLYRVRLRKNAEPWSRVDITKNFNIRYSAEIYCNYGAFGSKEFEIKIQTTSYGSQDTVEISEIIKYLQYAQGVAEFLKVRI